MGEAIHSLSGKKHPNAMGAPEINEFLTPLGAQSAGVRTCQK